MSVVRYLVGVSASVDVFHTFGFVNGVQLQGTSFGSLSLANLGLCSSYHRVHGVDCGSNVVAVVTGILSSDVMLVTSKFRHISLPLFPFSKSIPSHRSENRISERIVRIFQ
jgi:hypothetical protein